MSLRLNATDPTCDPHDFDERHAIQLATWETIPSAMIERLAEQRAHEIIHERSVEMLGMARRYAAEKGPAWLSLIEDAAAQPWEGR